jgi:hypothetical protein
MSELTFLNFGLPKKSRPAKFSKISDISEISKLVSELFHLTILKFNRILTKFNFISNLPESGVDFFLINTFWNQRKSVGFSVASLTHALQ